MRTIRLEREQPGLYHCHGFEVRRDGVLWQVKNRAGETFAWSRTLDGARSSIADMLKIWDADRPHFGGDAPHRFDFGGNCIYCGRPRNWK